MAECMQVDSSSEQADETMALASIFGEDFSEKNIPGCSAMYQIKVRVNLESKKIQINAWIPADEGEEFCNEEEKNEATSPVRKIHFHRSVSKKHTCLTLSVSHLTPLCLEFSFPENYPEKSKPVFTISCMWLDSSHLTSVCEKLDELWETTYKGEPVIFPWVDWLQNSLLEYLEVDDALSLRPCDLDFVTARDPRALPEFFDPKACALKILEYDFKMVQDEFRRECHTCEICFEEREGIFFHFLEECGHKFCVECLLDYCQLHVNEGTVKRLKCPENKCPVTLPPIIIRLLLSDEDFERWERLLFQQTLDGMADILYCPRCNAVVVMDEEEGSRLAQCGGCFFSFCTDCLMSWHSTQECGSGLKTDEEQSASGKKKSKKKKNSAMDTDDSVEGSSSLSKKERAKSKNATQRSMEFMMLQKRLGNYQRCPNCRIMVERTMGCDMMHCSRCSQKFCFRCGQKITGYGHFENCSQAANGQNIADRGRAMREGRPVADAVLRMNKMMEGATPGLELKFQACPRCRQRNMKLERNNHIKCWSCKADFCFMCKKLISSPVSAHFTASQTCQQHSDD